MFRNNGPNEWKDKLWRLSNLTAVVSGYSLLPTSLGKEWGWFLFALGVLLLAIAGIVLTSRARKRRDNP